MTTDRLTRTAAAIALLALFIPRLAGAAPAFDLQDPAGIVLQLLDEGAAVARLLPAGAVASHGCEVSLANKIAVVGRHVQEGRLAEAVVKLDLDVIPRFEPDLNRGVDPCVTDAAAVESLRGSVSLARNLLQELMGNARSVTVTPSRGGELLLDDGTVLSIPPGAVDRPTEVSMRSGKAGGDLAAGGVAWVDLSPDGLRLAAPATLGISFPPGSDLDPDQIEVDVFSRLHEAADADGESAIARPGEIQALDAQAGRVEVALEHFSTVVVSAPPAILVTPYLPPRFLAPADILFVLSNGTWIPGHTGLYSGTIPLGTGLADGLTVESTPDFDPLSSCGWLTFGGLPYFFGQGVSENLLTRSFIAPGRVYLGARRPSPALLPPAVRDAILGFARSRLGECYLPIGEPRASDQYWSCTELVVGSYLAANVRALLPFASRPWILPYDLWTATRPVDHVIVGVGETVEIPVRVAWRSSRLAPYREDPPGTALTASGSDVAALDPATRALRIAALDRHACATHAVTLTGSGPTGPPTAFTLEVEAHGFDFLLERPLGSTQDRQAEVGLRVSSPCAVALVQAELRLDGQTVAVHDDPASVATSVDLRFLPPAPLAYGSHQVKVEARDADGARSSAEWSFTVDPVFQTLRITLSGTGNGTVVSSPVGVACPGTCSAPFIESTLVTLAAAPAAGSLFREWRGDCSGTSASTTVDLSAAKTCEAVFDATCTPSPGVTITRMFCWNSRTSVFGPYRVSLAAQGQAQGCPGTSLYVTLHIVFDDGTIQDWGFGESGSISHGCPSSFLGATGQCRWTAGLNLGKKAASVGARATVTRGSTVVESTATEPCVDLN